MCNIHNLPTGYGHIPLLYQIYLQGFIANEAADPRGSAVELANHRAVRVSTEEKSQRKGLFLTIFGCK